MKHGKTPDKIEVRGAKANNLKNIDVDVPLNKYVAVCGVSGSGKSTLATDVLYAEGSRRYLQALSTYSRRRLGQTARPNVDTIRFLPSAIALRQRPVVPNVRSTVGTMSEILNVLRLCFSRLGSHVCPNGHRLKPSFDVAKTGELKCPVCKERFAAPGAEDFAFNSGGACPECHGVGQKKEINEEALLGDVRKSIREGAVLGWRVPGSFFYVPTAEALGIPVDIPFMDLTDEQKDFVLHGKQDEKVPVRVVDAKGTVWDMKGQYLNAADAVDHAYYGTESETVRQRLEKFYHTAKCPVCHGSRFRQGLLLSLLGERNIAEASALALDELDEYAASLASFVPKTMRPLAEKLSGELRDGLRPLLRLGLSYLSLDRGGGTLSTGELQRIQLARTLKNETNGVLYVLDEPSIGLHPQNVEGLLDVFAGLVGQGNSLVVVDHDLDVLRDADWVIEMGEGAGTLGGRVIAEGKVAQIEKNAKSVISGYLAGREPLIARERAPEPAPAKGKSRAGKAITATVDGIYTLKNVAASIPIGKLTAITGVSGSGKSSLILDAITPAIQATLRKQPVPSFVKNLKAPGIRRVVMVDAAPVGKNVRSTVATYSGVFDDVRELLARTPEAKARKWNAGRFSHNVATGACPTCGGTGQISLDIQYLPDMDLVCPDCGGTRYAPETLEVTWNGKNIAEILALTISEAQFFFAEHERIREKLDSLDGLGLGYLSLGESTPTLSGGEAQRLKLVSELGRSQQGSLFVFDEPTTGLHPKDIRKLLQVFDSLIGTGGTIIVIEHDLDLIANSDYVIDMGPGGGDAGGRIIAEGTPEELCRSEASFTGKYLREYARRFGLDW